MGSEKDAGRAPRLVVDLNAGAVLLDGHRVEPTPTQFKVLSVLVANPGEVVGSDELVEQVWPGMAMTPDQVRWHVWGLRDALGDNQRDHKIVGNRRGFGYFIDLPPEEVTVLHASGEAAPQVPRPTVPDDQGLQETTESVLPESEDLPPRAEPPPSRSRPRRILLPLALAVSLALVGSSWVVGFELSRRRAPQPSPSPSAPLVAPPSPAAEQSGGDRLARTPRPPQRRQPGRQRAGATGARLPVPAQAGQPASPTAEVKGRQTARSPRQPKLPPPPTSLLYHLYNPDTDDHFVTTDGNIARQQEGRGYEGAAIARVYTYREKNTKPISTNHGTAFIFISSTPKTDPASKVTELYYATDNAGDFFYTTRRLEAEQEGWESWVIGYVRRL